MPNRYDDLKQTAEDAVNIGGDPFHERGYISMANKRKIKSWILRNERLPREDELKDFTSWQLWGTRDDRWIDEVNQYINELAESDPEISKVKEAHDAKGDTDVFGAEKYFWDESKLHEEGTKEADLYDFYRNMGQAQHEVGKTELARSERDMQVEMAQQRSQLVDEVRKRRTNQLRSGLSSAQVANEEIQMLLMGQQAQQQTAQQHFDARTQMNQQQQMNPYQAELQARQHIQGGQQGTSAHYAAFTADPIGTSRAYAGMSPQEQSKSDYFLGTQKDN